MGFYGDLPSGNDCYVAAIAIEHGHLQWEFNIAIENCHRNSGFTH